MTPVRAPDTGAGVLRFLDEGILEDIERAVASKEHMRAGVVDNIHKTIKDGYLQTEVAYDDTTRTTSFITASALWEEAMPGEDCNLFMSSGHAVILDMDN